MNRRRSIALLICSIVATNPSRAGEPTAEDFAFFESKVRPVLVENCFSCHSEGKNRKGGLWVDSRAALLEGGDSGPAIRLDAPAESPLLQAVRHDEALGLKMPPKKRLADQHIAALERWIQRGAPWPKSAQEPAKPKKDGPRVSADDRAFWSFAPLKQVRPPVVRDASWVKSPIDAFLLRQREDRRLPTAAPADKRSLLRRASFDLTGLPPTTEEMQAFLADDSPQAWAKAVDRLLAAPAYGERWARHWLDVVRFAETDGHEFDTDKPNAYRYRDYVIRALNDDLPYDQFVREHIAGDLLAQPRVSRDGTSLESPIATGFYWFGELLNSPIDGPAARADRVENQLDTLGKAFLGLSLGCCRCHDHKFDPLPTRDYYGLAGFIYSTRAQQTCIDSPARARQIAELSRRLLEEDAKRTTLVLERFAKSALAQWSAVQAEVGSALEQWVAPPAISSGSKEPAKSSTKKNSPAAAPWSAFLRQGVEDGLLGEFIPTQPTPLGSAVLVDDFEGEGKLHWYRTGPAFADQPASPWMRVDDAGRWDVVEGYVGSRLVHTGRVSPRLTGIMTSRPLKIAKPFLHARIAGADHRGEACLRLNVEGYREPALVMTGGNQAKLGWKTLDVGRWKDQECQIEIFDLRTDGFIAVDAVYFSDSPAPPNLKAQPTKEAVAALADPKRRAEAADRLLGRMETILKAWSKGDAAEAPASLADPIARWMLASVSPLLTDRLQADVVASRPRRAALEQTIPESTYALTAAEDVPVDVAIHLRGNVHTLGLVVPRKAPDLLSAGGEAINSKESGRLELAEHLTDPGRNPLLARVMVNRLWQHHFGAGLVRTPNDFGRNGDKPENIELLDYLARRFIEGGWSLKAMHRLLLLSSTYQLSSRSFDSEVPESSADPAQAREQALAADPLNRTLAFMPVRRLEAESLRDAILATAGALDRRLYGPSVATHLTPYMDGRGRPGRSGPLDGERRRSIYLEIRRNFLHPMFLAFDYPPPLASIGRRAHSTVPSQALYLLNNSFVAEQADRWAERVLAEGSGQRQSSNRERIERMFQEAFARPPESGEMREAEQFLRGQASLYRGQAEAERRAWADFAHILFCSAEFSFVP